MSTSVGEAVSDTARTGKAHTREGWLRLEVSLRDIAMDTKLSR